MADVNFAFYWTAQGTSTARPVFMFLTLDQATVPDVSDYPGSAAVLVTTMPTMEPASDANKNQFTVDPATGIVSVVPVVRKSLEERRGLIIKGVMSLIQDWVRDTQSMESKASTTSRRAARDYIVALRAALVTLAASTNPEAVVLPSAPTITNLATDQGEVLERAQPAQNFIENARWLDGTTSLPDGITHTATGTGAGTAAGETTMAVVPAGQPYSGADFSTLSFVQNGTSTDAILSINFVKVTASGTLSNTFGGRLMPVKVGEWICLYIQSVAVNCTGSFRLVFVDAAGVVVGSVVVVGTVPNAAGNTTNPEEWTAYGGIYQVPAGVSYAYAQVVKTPTVAGQSTSSLYLHAPRLMRATERQGQVPPFVAENPRYMGSGRLRLLGISRAVLADNAVSDKLAADATGNTTTALQGAHRQALTGAAIGSIIVGPVTVGDVWTVCANIRARKKSDGTADPYFGLQYSYLDPDSLLYTNWKNFTGASLAAADISTSFESYPFFGVFSVPTTDFQIRMSQTGIGADTTFICWKLLNIRAQKITK